LKITPHAFDLHLKVMQNNSMFFFFFQKTDFQIFKLEYLISSTASVDFWFSFLFFSSLRFPIVLSYKIYTCLRQLSYCLLGIKLNSSLSI
jgi:hypothetical protein